MLHGSLSLLAAGLLLLKSCSQPATSAASSGTAAPTSATPEAASVLAVQQALTDLRTSQARVDAGGAAPVDASGQTIDLQALIQSYEADLAAATRAALFAPAFHPLDAYSQNYFVIVDDDHFRANHAN